METRVNLLLSIGQPSDGRPASNRPALYDKVKYALDCLQGDYNTKRATVYIAKVYQHLCCIDDSVKTPLQKKIMRMIVPELEIHLPHLLNSAQYMQYKETRDSTESPKIDEYTDFRKGPR